MVLAPHAKQAKLHLDKQAFARAATQDVTLAQHLMEHKFAHNAQLNMAMQMELALNVQPDRHQEEHRLHVYLAPRDATLVAR